MSKLRLPLFFHLHNKDFNKHHERARRLSWTRRQDFVCSFDRLHRPSEQN